MSDPQSGPPPTSGDHSPSAQRLAEVEALSGIGSWEWEIESDRLLWSEQLRRIYGVTDPDAALSYADFVSRVHPDDREGVQAIVQHALEARSSFVIDHRIVHPDGAIRHLHSRGYVLLDEDGNPVRMLGSAQDVTEARAAEQERTDAERSRAAGQARDEVLALLAHDLRSPLTGVLGFAQLLARHARGGSVDTDKLLGYVTRIEESARQMTSLLDDLLTDADPHAADDDLETEPIDLAGCVRRIAAHHDGLGGPCEIVVEAPDRPVMREVHPAKLERALHNLVTNAVKYSPHGGTVTIGLVEHADGVRISVADHGIGIPPQDRSRIFDRFHRGSNVTGLVSGLGLGLASVARAVDAHGGTIEVDSEEGRGTTFTIHLPQAT